MSYDYEGNNQFPVAVTLPDDGDTPGQTTFAPGWEGNRDAVVYLLHRTGASPLYNFNAPSVATASYAWAAFDWDDQTVTAGGATFALMSRWVATQTDGSNATRFQMCLDGKNWILSGATATTATCLSHSLTVSANVAANFCTTSKVVYATLTSGVTAVAASAGWNATQGCAWDNRTTSKAYFIGASQSGATFTGAAASFTPTGPTTVNLSANLPVNWVSGTNHVGNYRYATDGTTYVVLMCGVTPVTDTARLLNAGVIATPTDITPSVLANKIGIGIAWDPLTALWILCAADTSTGYIYTSPDLIAWTLAATPAETSTHIKEFAVVNGAWILVVNDYQGQTGTSTIYISSSFGTRWDRAQVAVGDTTPTFAAGATSILFGDATTYGIAISNSMSMA